MGSSQLIAANRSGLPVARWQTMRHTDELILEVFQETPVDSGLLEAIVLSVVLLRSGRSLGNSDVGISNPRNNTSLPTGSMHRHGAFVM